MISTIRTVTAAISVLFPTLAISADPVYVVRPPIIQMRANVLPQSAFTAPAAPGVPTTPTPTTPTAPNDGYVFKSSYFDSPPDPAGSVIGTPQTATVSLTGKNGGRFDNTLLPSNGFCDIMRSAKDDPRKKEDVMYVPDMSGGSEQERYILPLVTGKMGVVFMCDAVGDYEPSDPRSRYYGKVTLTVIP